jgi:eukaryotic-like serine/threonine-protein kinase
MDWKVIEATVDKALTLEGADFDKFLQAHDQKDETSDAIREFLTRLNPKHRFMETSISGTATPIATLSPKTLLGVWKIDSLVGRGGMGDVYRAERADGLYQQIVALKIVRTGNADRNARFEQERQRLALMEHPGISRIIDGGNTDAGNPFMVMEYVDGTPIDTYVEKSGFARTRKLKIFAHLCDAVSHAHSKLILHRDIKPANVLVDAAGQVRLIDFGISSSLENIAGLGGAFTLAYAAPEQLLGEAVTVATDVHALGVLLHVLLVGTRPERQADASMHADAVSLADKDIEAIVIKCLSADPQDRYRSVDALRDDIFAYINRLPVSARTAGAAYRVGKFLRRHPLSSALTAAFVLTLAGGLAASLAFANQAKAEAERAKVSLAKAEFYLERADLHYSAQNAYADALQRMFGNDADVDRQTEALKSRWREAYALRTEDPENAAFVTHAIGRHFIFRNDYQTAIEIYEPWIKEAFGPEDLLGYGRQLLAVAYMNSGETDKALPILREVENWYASSYEAKSADHIASASQIATITKDPADIAHAEKLILAGLKKGDDFGPNLHMYFWYQLAMMRQFSGNFDGAHQALRSVIEVIDENQLMDIGGTDTGQLNLAYFEFYRRTDLPLARRIAEHVLTKTGSERGESRETGRAMELLALLLADEHDYEAARAHAMQAVDIVERFSGPTSQASLNAKSTLVEILSEMGDATAAAEHLSSLRSDLSASDKTAELRTRVALASAYFAAKFPELDQQPSPSDFEMDHVRRSVLLTSRYENLVQQGYIQP